MSDLGNTTTPVEKPVENAEKVDEVKQEESLTAKEQDADKAEAPEVKAKGKGKAAESHADEEDDEDDDDDDEDDEDEDEDDDDDLDFDEVDPSDIIPPSTRRSARSGQIDYSSEEALKKAGLQGGTDSTAAATLPADDDDEDFKADESMEQD